MYNLFYAVGKNLRFFIGDRENMGCQKFRPPKSSMGSYFQQKFPQKRRFFEFWGSEGVPTTKVNIATL